MLDRNGILKIIPFNCAFLSYLLYNNSKNKNLTQPKLTQSKINPTYRKFSVMVVPSSTHRNNT